MRVLTKEEFDIEIESHVDKILKGSVFIHPTDTIYGLGCNALDSKAVKRIREIKKRPEAPFSVIAPSKPWIKENCVIDESSQEWFDMLPGPYTLVLKLKNKNCVTEEVNKGRDSLGVRLPRHWFNRVVRKLGVPVVTTSINEAGKKFVASIDEIDPEMRSRIDFAIDEGEKKGRPSKIINLVGEEVLVKER